MKENLAYFSHLYYHASLAQELELTKSQVICTEIGTQSKIEKKTITRFKRH